MRNADTKTDVIAVETTFAAGVRAHLSKRLLTIHKTSVKAEAIAAQVDDHIALVKATELARTRWLQAIAAERAAGASVKQLIRAVQAYALATFGDDSPEYTDFGFAPKKKRAQSPASKVSAANKLRATRAARHTMGKKQRQAIKGTVPTPPQEVSSPVSSVSSAPGVSAGGAAAPIVVVPAPAAAAATGAVTNPTTPSNGSGYANGANGASTGAAYANGVTNGYAKSS